MLDFVQGTESAPSDSSLFADSLALAGVPNPDDGGDDEGDYDDDDDNAPTLTFRSKLLQ